MIHEILLLLFKFFTLFFLQLPIFHTKAIVCDSFFIVLPRIMFMINFIRFIFSVNFFTSSQCSNAECSILTINALLNHHYLSELQWVINEIFYATLTSYSSCSCITSCDFSS
ncbi:hypothetical protein O6H91_03G087900 [Diphasiastrum complanatum]|uniref:Uncharacterized protein n=1 Tax=Diphasiastrum complanatum TaxID=34168 RepID=A0ACC2E8V8_DIPCM|nr:hypothetical protein O6H91_03G087900 [Diphasiastrum complanatum]